MPDVGEGLVEAEIVTWKVQVGDVVALNQPLVDIETAKATVKLPSPYAGTVVKLHGNVGDVMEVHKPLITFDVGGAPGASAPAREEAPAVSAPAAAPKPQPEKVVKRYSLVTASRMKTVWLRGRIVEGVRALRARLRRRPRSRRQPSTGLAPRSTPPVRLYAKQHGIDLAALKGSGRGRAHQRGDVERALQPNGTQPQRANKPISGPTSPSHFVGRDIESWSTGPKEERIPVKGVLRSMSEAMVQSAFSAPHAAVWVRVDATGTMDLLAGLKNTPTWRACVSRHS